MMAKVIRFLMGASLFLSPKTWRELKAEKVTWSRVFWGLLLYMFDEGFRQIVQTKMVQLRSSINEPVEGGESIIAVLTSSNGQQRRIVNELS